MHDDSVKSHCCKKCLSKKIYPSPPQKIRRPVQMPPYPKRATAWRAGREKSIGCHYNTNTPRRHKQSYAWFIAIKNRFSGEGATDAVFAKTIIIVIIITSITVRL